jgi:ribonuclease Z
LILSSHPQTHTEVIFTSHPRRWAHNDKSAAGLHKPAQEPQIYALRKGSGLHKITKRAISIMGTKAPAGDRQIYDLRVVETPTADTPGTALMLTFAQKSYLFGHVSEGTQRAIHDRGVSIAKMHDVFVTGVTNWESIGGLIGLILSTATTQEVTQDQNQDPQKKGKDLKNPAYLNIHSSSKLRHALVCARRFVFRKGMPVTIHEQIDTDFVWPCDPTFTDEHIKVWALPLKGLKTDTETSTNTKPDSNVSDEQELRQSIIDAMFNSSWTKDGMDEVPFADVALPATVFRTDAASGQVAGFYCTSHDDARFNPDEKVKVRKPWPAAMYPSIPSASNLPSDLATSYIVRGHTQRGKFDPQKAKELGVTPGPAFRRLVAGESLEVADGQIVTPEMVVGPSRTSNGFAIFDLPTSSHLKSLTGILSRSSSDILDNITDIVWRPGPGVSGSPDFKELLQNLDQVHHWLSDVDTAANKIAFRRAAVNAHYLASINPTNFSIPEYNNSAPHSSSTPVSNVSFGDNVQRLDDGLTIALEPTRNVDRSMILPDEIEDFMRVKLPPSIAPQDLKLSPTYTPGSALTEPEIITLGTGSSMPSIYRNVSATLIRLPHEQGNFLLDCGEDTIGQLRRAFPAQELAQVLRNLQGIWISHLHADHHLGTVSVIQERAKAFDALGDQGKNLDRTIVVMSEEGMLSFLKDYSSIEPTLFSNAGLVPLHCFEGRILTLDGKEFDLESTTTAIREVQSVRVSHCKGAQAVSITFKSGFKVSYSGDCRPSARFCEIGLDSDLLIHEATFDDEMQEDAKKKKHSTTGEALAIAIKMRAKNTILTHFSQRYAKLPMLDSVKSPEEVTYEEVNADAEDDEPIDDMPAAAPEEAHQSDVAERRISEKPARSSNVQIPTMSVAIAFDNMRIRLSEIAGFKEYFPRLQEMMDFVSWSKEQLRDQTHAESMIPVLKKQIANMSRGARDTKKERKTPTGKEGAPAAEKPGIIVKLEALHEELKAMETKLANSMLSFDEYRAATTAAADEEENQKKKIAESYSQAPSPATHMRNSSDDATKASEAAATASNGDAPAPTSSPVMSKRAAAKAALVQRMAKRGFSELGNGQLGVADVDASKKLRRD